MGDSDPTPGREQTACRGPARVREASGRSGLYRIRIGVRGALILGVLSILLVFGATLAWKHLSMSESDRVQVAIDQARDALVDGSDEEFLAVFSDDVVYQETRGFEDLRQDLSRWRTVGLTRVDIYQRRVELDPPESPDARPATGRAELGVAVGQLFRGTTVTVFLEFSREDERWTVTSFRWSR